MTTEAPITYAALPTSQDARDDCNAFLRRYHGTKAAVPSLEFERDILTKLDGAPPVATVIATDGLTIIGAATSWMRVGAYEQLRGRVSEARAIAWLRRWPLLTHIAVNGSYRHAGIGRTLVDLVETQVAQNGARGLWGYAADMPNPSWPFYQSLGYTILEADQPVILGGIASLQSPGERPGKHFYKLFHTRPTPDGSR